jgi:hypothetical protein
MTIDCVNAYALKTATKHDVMSSSNDGDFTSEHTVPGRQAASEALSLANSNSNISGIQPV